MRTIFALLSAGALGGLLAPALPPRATAPARPVAAETYAVDGGHSSVVFRVGRGGISEFHGRFNRIGEQSRVVLDGDKSSILLVIDAASVDTNSGDRDNHLRSADFFGAKEFPEIVFESKSAKGAGDAWDVAGELSFRGVTKPVTAKARKVGAGEMRGRQVAGFVAELEIDMNDFGVPFAKQNPKALGPEVYVTVSLECVRE